MSAYTHKSSGFTRCMARLVVLVLVCHIMIFDAPHAESSTMLLVNNESFNTIDSGDGATDRTLRFGTSSLTLLYNISNSRFEFSRSVLVGGTLTATGSVIAKTTVSGATMRVSGNADVQGALSASGAVRFDSNLTLNDDLTAADVTLTFGNNVSSAVMTYSNTFKEFYFDKGIRTAGTISGSGGLVFEGAASGSSLYLGTSLRGAGLGTDCDDGVNSKILWDTTTGRFSCGSDQGGAGSGLSQPAGDARYVNQSGDTMTGTLAIQNGSTHLATNSPLLNVRGAMSGVSLFVTGTGSQPILFTDKTRGHIGIGTNDPTERLTMSGGTFFQMPGTSPQTLSGVNLTTNVNSIFVSGNYVYAATDSVSGDDIRTIDISNPNAPSILGGFDTGADAKAIFVSTKHMFVGLNGSGAGSGFLILDNTNPGAQTRVTRLNFGSAVNAIYVSGKYAYVGLNGLSSGFCSAKSQVFTGCDFVVVDFTSPNSPRVIGGIQFTVAVNSIYVQNRYVYAGLNSVSGNDFRVIDLANPADPQVVGGVDYSNNVKSVFVSGKYAFLGLSADAGNPEFRVVDISVKSAPVNVGSLELGTDVQAVNVTGDWGRLGLASVSGDDYLSIDLRNPLLPVKRGGIDFGVAVNSIVVGGKYAYVGLASVSGNDMRILDLSGIDTPAATIGSLSTANFFASDNVRFDNNAYIRNALNVGRGGIISKGPLSVQSTGTGYVRAQTGVLMSAFDVRNGTGQLLFNVTDDGIVSGGIPSSSTGSTMQLMNHPVWGRQTGWAAPITTTATVLTSTNLSTLTPVNTGVSAAGIAGDRAMVKFTALNTSGNAGGIIGPYTSTRLGYRPRYTAIIRTSTGTTNLRFWGGLAESSPIALSPSLSSAATAIDYVAMAWEDTVNGGKWMCCSGDGTNHTCVDMGAPPVATSTVYFLDVDASYNGRLTCRLNVNGRVYTTTKTTNLPNGGVNLGVQTTITTKVTGGTAVCRNFAISKIGLEQN